MIEFSIRQELPGCGAYRLWVGDSGDSVMLSNGSGRAARTLMKRSPSRLWFLFAALVFLVGAIGTPVVMVLALVQITGSGEEFHAPGHHVFEAPRPGRYVVWTVTSAFRDGRQTEFPENLPPGMRIRIVDESDGSELPTSAALNATEESGGTKRRAIFSFDVPAPGAYSVIAENSDEPRLLMVRASILSRVILVGLAGFLVTLLSWILAPAIAIVVVVRRSRSSPSSG